MSDYKMEKAEDKKAVFHGGFFYLERINEILKALDHVTTVRHIGPNYETLWRQNYSLLISLFKEIYPKMNKDERTEHLEASKVVKEQFNSAMQNYKNGNSFSTIFLDYFDLWEINLRDITEMRGLNMPNKADMSDAADL